MRALAALLLWALALPAAGAALTVTYRDANCAEFRMTGSGANFTIECASSVPPVPTPEPPEPPPTGGNVTCVGFSKTIFYDVWQGSAYKRYLTSETSGGFTPTTAIVVRISVPAGIANLTGYGSLSGFEYTDPQTSRHAVISKAPCDWSNTVGSPYYQQIGYSFDWSLTVQSAEKFLYHEVQMVAGRTYYINIKNGANKCNAAHCNMAIDWNKPH